MQKHSILFLCKLYHPHVGGVEKHVEELSKELVKRGFSIIIITEQYDESLVRKENIGEVLIVRIPVGKSVFLKKFYIWKWMLLHLNLLYRADIIHIHDVFYWVLPFWVLIFFRRIYITFHGYESFPIKLKWKMQRKVAEVLTRDNICVGDFMKKWYKTVPGTVIYGGVRLEKESIESKPQSAVFFGRLDNQTGIEEYLRAYKNIKLKYPNFTLTVIGEGEFEEKIPEDVKTIPFKKDIGRYIAKNKFIFVSRYLSMLEALAQKREVIAIYDNPVKRDYLLMSPFKNYVTVAKNSKEIEDFVVSVLQKGSSEERVENGYKWSKEQTWGKIADIYMRLWKVL